jgi:competence protein ComEC
VRNGVTRFRAYQLGTHGSSFSYFANGHFTLLEGRLTDKNRPTLLTEMEKCSVSSIDTLHITSWDTDHCASAELEELLSLTKPTRIECPGYTPYLPNAKECQKIIDAYKRPKQNQNREVKIQSITPIFVQSLKNAQDLAYNNIFYNPRVIDENCPNNNSTVALFRGGSFNVLSLGDVEDANIAVRLRRSRLLAACRT